MILLWTALAMAGDHSNLEDGLPISVVDTQPIGYLGREIQMLTRYELTKDGADQLLIEPRLEYGIIRNGQISLTGPVLLGENLEEGLRALRAEALYAISRERLVLPGFALFVETKLPLDPEESFDPLLQLVVTKSVPGTMQHHRFHLNGGVQFNTDEAAGEREAAYRFVVGYDARLFNDLIFLADYVREQDLEEEEAEHNLIELGLRHQLIPRIVVSAGAGFGFAAESPQIRPALALQASI